MHCQASAASTAHSGQAASHQRCVGTNPAPVANTIAVTSVNNRTARVGRSHGAAGAKAISSSAPRRQGFARQSRGEGVARGPRWTESTSRPKVRRQ